MVTRYCAQSAVFLVTGTRVACLITAILISACSQAFQSPAWYPPAPCSDCYQGEGEAATCTAALERARRSLCEDIRVVVESEASDARNHVLRQAQSASGEFNSSHFNEVVRVLTTTRSRCVFESVPIQEQRSSQSAGCFVVLRLGIAEYQRHLESRTVLLQTNGNAPEWDIGQALEAAAEHLRASGFVVLRQGTGKYLATLTFGASVASAGAEFSDVLVATGSVGWVVTRLEDGVEIERSQLPSVMARGFKQEAAVRNLLAEMARSLRELWRLL